MNTRASGSTRCAPTWQRFLWNERGVGDYSGWNSALGASNHSDTQRESVATPMWSRNSCCPKSHPSPWGSVFPGLILTSRSRRRCRLPVVAATEQVVKLVVDAVLEHTNVTIAKQEVRPGGVVGAETPRDVPVGPPVDAVRGATVVDGRLNLRVERHSRRDVIGTTVEVEPSPVGHVVIKLRQPLAHRDCVRETVRNHRKGNLVAEACAEPPDIGRVPCVPVVLARRVTPVAQTGADRV